MPYWNITQINGTTFDQAYVGTAVAFPWLFPLLLFFEFCLIFVGGLTIQNRKVGFSNVPMWGSIAGLVTSTTAFLWSVVSATINETSFTLLDLGTIGICISATIGFAAWFIFSDLE